MEIPAFSTMQLSNLNQNRTKLSYKNPKCFFLDNIKHSLQYETSQNIYPEILTTKI